jgi:hypothetical protein
MLVVLMGQFLWTIDHYSTSIYLYYYMAHLITSFIVAKLRYQSMELWWSIFIGSLFLLGHIFNIILYPFIESFTSLVYPSTTKPNPLFSLVYPSTMISIFKSLVYPSTNKPPPLLSLVYPSTMTSISHSLVYQSTMISIFKSLVYPSTNKPAPLLSLVYPSTMTSISHSLFYPSSKKSISKTPHYRPRPWINPIMFPAIWLLLSYIMIPSSVCGMLNRSKYCEL